MTSLQPDQYTCEFEPLTTVERRFGVEMMERDVAASAVVMSMPITDMTNPFSGIPTLSPLAILVDAAAGRANHIGCTADEWTVSSELSLELSPAANDDVRGPVTATARALDRKGPTSVSLCTLTSGTETIGWGTVRSYFISADRIVDDRLDESPEAKAYSLAELMAVQIRSNDQGMSVLMQQPNPAINNRIGAVHGGVATAGLELAAAAAIAAEGNHMATASIRVNFLRPFMSSEQSHYLATPLRIGRTSAVADAQAIGADGRTAIVARVTAYR
jgi:uncharacterized protein (TIGR00369 family)